MKKHRLCIHRWARKRFNAKLKWFERIAMKSPMTCRDQQVFLVFIDKMAPQAKVNNIWVSRSSFFDQPVLVCPRKKKILIESTANANEKNQWSGCWSGNSECCNPRWREKVRSYLLRRPTVSKQTVFIFHPNHRSPYRAITSTSSNSQWSSKSLTTRCNEADPILTPHRLTMGSRQRMKVSSLFSTKENSSFSSCLSCFSETLT